MAVGHRRLAIIDLSSAANQPMSDSTGRYTIVFNGEFFNFKNHQELVRSKGFTLRSASDTEVLLYLYIMEEEKCLQRINGFFALAIYDHQNGELFLARDRYGVKPLLYYAGKDYFVFASEMKSLLAYGPALSLDYASLFAYLQLNYVPPPHSIFNEVKKLRPGHFMRIHTHENTDINEQCWYHLPEYDDTIIPYESARKELERLTEEAVKRRLISDVPLGCFLSGGIDSSIVAALAARHTSHLKTFTIGFRDEPHFDETKYAAVLARRYRTDHTVFSLTTDDLFGIMDEVLDYLDEPFADSSALNVYILSKQVRQQVTVILSGDGADELFGGYHKHRAELLIRKYPMLASSLSVLAPLLSAFSGSRQTAAGNRLRQLHRFAKGAGLDASKRYWRWCSLASEKEAASLLMHLPSPVWNEYTRRKQEIISSIHGHKDMNDVLKTDFHLVLAGDMLVKVDLMSMAHGLEIRNPFLDFELVNFVFRLPSNYKLSMCKQKKILKETFAPLLPREILHRGKKGFEVPLLRWFRARLHQRIEHDWLDEGFIREQKIFQPAAVRQLKGLLNASFPGEAVGRLWALIVFQHWWKKYHRLFNI
jgi:asparagine synthase (glutamine-hydrolysing)